MGVVMLSTSEITGILKIFSVKYFTEILKIRENWFPRNYLSIFVSGIML